MSLPKAPFQSQIADAIGRAETVWVQWFDRVQETISANTSSGPTSGRPTQNLFVGQQYFDTTLGKPVYWNGSTWITW
jgi:hypothetical protein